MYHTQSAIYDYNPETDVIEITQKSSGFSVQISFTELDKLFTTASDENKRTASLLNGAGELSRTNDHLHCKGAGINTYLNHNARQELRKYIFDKREAYQKSRQHNETIKNNLPWGDN